MKRGFPVAALIVSLAAVAAFSLPASAEPRLLMFESKWCEWCEKWDEEVGVIYGQTAEGRQAPLERVDIHGDPPADVELDRMAHFTPTFVLVHDGREVGRIEGYPGADFFYGLLGQLLERRPGGGADRSTGAKG